MRRRQRYCKLVDARSTESDVVTESDVRSTESDLRSTDLLRSTESDLRSTESDLSMLTVNENNKDFYTSLSLSMKILKSYQFDGAGFGELSRNPR